MEGTNVRLLVYLIFMMFMIEQVDARRPGLGRGNRRGVSTSSMENAFNPYHPTNPTLIYSFVNAILSLFGLGPGAWGPDPKYDHWAGPLWTPPIEPTDF